MTEISENLYRYKALVKAVIDGDTLDLEIDLGMSIFVRERIRLSGIDTHEIFGVKVGSEEYKLGMKSKSRVEELLTNKTIYIVTTKDKKEKYGRYLAKVYLNDGTCINDLLITEGLARPFM